MQHLRMWLLIQASNVALTDAPMRWSMRALLPRSMQGSRWSIGAARGHRARAGLLVLLSLLFQGCALQQWQSTGVGRYLDSHSLTETLAKLESQSPNDRDLPMHLLNRGLVHHLLGNYQRSNQDLEAAKIALEKVQALSLTEGLTSSTINETFTVYSATPSERVLLHTLMALNYLALQDLSSARVEALQSDLRIRELADENADLASARFISGIIFELNTEWSDAMISYRKAEQILTRRKLPIPDLLQQRLLQISQQLGQESEYQQYRTRFPRALMTLPENYGEVMLLYLKGKVPSKQQQMISLYVPSLAHHVTIAQPYYPPKTGYPLVTSQPLGTEQVKLQLLEDVDELAREALQAGQAKRIALSLARVTAKHQLVKNSRKKDPILGLLSDLTAILTETADIRSWNLLPAVIQIGVIQLPAGSYIDLGDLDAKAVAVKGADVTPVDLNSVDLNKKASGSPPRSRRLEVKAGATQLLIANSYRPLGTLVLH